MYLWCVWICLVQTLLGYYVPVVPDMDYPGLLCTCGVFGFARYGLLWTFPSRLLFDMWWLGLVRPCGRCFRVADAPRFFFSSSRSSFRASESSSG